jgi:hypothetical protein
LPWTAPQAAWHHAASAALAITLPRPSPESANTRKDPLFAHSGDGSSSYRHDA